MSILSPGLPTPMNQASSSSSRTPPRPVAVKDANSDSDDDPILVHPMKQGEQFENLHKDNKINTPSSQQNVDKPVLDSRFLAAEGTAGLLSPSPQSAMFGSDIYGPYTPITPSSTRDRYSTGNIKDFDSHDRVANEPGQRVGYEDMTAIDWIFEYTKERQRLQILNENATGLIGYMRQFMDSSQVWIVLISTGLAAGMLAAAIDIASNWLGDLKTGYCSSGQDGGYFYLNRYFCCFGYDELIQCNDWVSWNTALGITSVSSSRITNYLLFTLSSIVFAFTASFLVKEYALFAQHSGIPEVKTVLGGFVIRRFMGSWTLIVKSLGLCLAVASGMWLGKEGPLVHVACCCANIFIKFFKHINENEARKREVLSAAAAAGISVAFASPIGGVLFSLEQLSYFFPDKTMWRSFVCAMTAAVVLQAFDPFRSGKLVLYQVTYSSGWHGFEIIPFAFLGIFGGLYGGIFIKLNMKIAKFKKSTTWLPGPTIQVVIVALLTALINYPNIYMRAQSSELVYSLFAECSKVVDDQFELCKTGPATVKVIFLLIVAATLGFFLASITFGLQIPAGIILPSMAIGALFGRAVGITMEILVQNYPNFLLFTNCEPDIPCITPGTYAIIGATAALGGVTRMTVSIVVIMFELTGALTYVLPIMIAVIVSKWVGDAFGKRGIYESWIHLNEYPFLDNSEETFIPDIPVSQIMTRIQDLVVLTATGHTVESLTNILVTHPYRGFPVISDSRNATLLGYISRAELLFNLHTSQQEPHSLPPNAEVYFSHQPRSDPRTTLDLRRWMDQTPLTLPSRSNLLLTITYFQKLGLRYVLFSDRGTLQGLLTKKDAWLVLNGAEKNRKARGVDGMRVTTGLTRESNTGEERGLLDDHDNSDLIPGSPRRLT